MPRATGRNGVQVWSSSISSFMPVHPGAFRDFGLGKARCAPIVAVVTLPSVCILLTTASIMEAWLRLSSLTWGATCVNSGWRPACRVRQLSDLAGISNPYLSQIERGLKKPSADILQQIAHGLSMSAESLYIRAGILEEGSERSRDAGGPRRHRRRPVADAPAARRPRRGLPGLRQPGA